MTIYSIQNWQLYLLMNLINPFLIFFSPTKACIVASVIFVLDKKTEFISAPHALVYFGIVIFFVYFKVTIPFSGKNHSEIQIENQVIICNYVTICIILQ